MKSYHGLRRWCAAAFLVSVWSLSAESAGFAATPAFQGLGFLPGGTSSSPTLMSGDGAVVMGTSGPTTLDAQIFTWGSAAGMRAFALQPDNANSVYLAALSGDGSVVAGTSDSNPPSQAHAFLWTQAGGVSYLFPSPPSSASVTGTYLTGISADGNTVAGYCNYQKSISSPPYVQDVTQGFVLTQGVGTQWLGDNTHATAISENGLVAFGYYVAGQAPIKSEAFRRTQVGGTQGLGFTGYITAASTDGSVAVGTAQDPVTLDQKAFRWTQSGGVQYLGFLGTGTYAHATSVSGDGYLVVGTADDGTASRAFIWDPDNGMRSFQDFLTGDLGLALPGWTLTGVTQNIWISSDGQVVVGSGTDPGGSNEAWRATIASLPTVPVVTADPIVTVSSSTLQASWSSSDHSSGIAEYQFAIGNAPDDPGSGYVVPWTPAGTETSVTQTGLSLVAGQRYYVYVRARNAYGLWSHVGVSNPVLAVDHVVSSPGSAKLLPDGAAVEVQNVSVTATTQQMGDWMYVEALDRASGLGVQADLLAELGDRVTVAGTMSTVDGERTLSAAVLVKESSGRPLAPFAITLQNALSGAFNYVPGTGAGQRPISDGLAVNLSTVGLLIKVTGQVMDADSTYVYVNDGTWPLYYTGVRIDRINLPSSINIGDTVSVAGVSSIRKTGSIYQMLIRPRTPDDYQVRAPAGP